MKIYRKNVLTHDLLIDDRTTIKRRLMVENSLNLSVAVPKENPLNLAIGDYTDIGPERYIIMDEPQYSLRNGVYEYSVLMRGNLHRLEVYMMPDEGRDEWWYYGSVVDQINKVLAILNTKELGWSVVLPDLSQLSDLSPKNINYANMSVLSAFHAICNAENGWGLEFDVEGKKITFAKEIKRPTQLQFEYGKGKGLYELSRGQSSGEKVATRVYGYGGEANMPNGQRLDFASINEGKSYIEKGVDLYGLRETRVNFDHIYPRRNGAITSNATQVEVGRANWIVIDSTLDFDLNAQTVEESVIMFNTGDCVGVEFKIVHYDHATKTITFAESVDENSVETYVLPNADRYPKAGDEYIFVNILMPESYILAAKNELKAAVIEHTNKVATPQRNYTVKCDPRYFKSLGSTPIVGDGVRLIDVANGVDYVSRVIEISYPVIYPYNVGMVLSDKIPIPAGVVMSKSIKEIKTKMAMLDRGNLTEDHLRKIFHPKGGSGDMDFQANEILAKLVAAQEINAEVVNATEKVVTNEVGSSNFTEGIVTSGFKIWLEDGKSSAMFNKLKADELIVDLLTIQKVQAIGGVLILTPAYANITKVETIEQAYKCYYKPDISAQMWVVGDQALCKNRGKYYWRLVTSVSEAVDSNGEFWLNLSTTTADGSGIPTEGDEIVLLGHRGANAERTNALILSSGVLGYSNPFTYYQGITAFSLADKEMFVIGEKTVFKCHEFSIIAPDGTVARTARECGAWVSGKRYYYFDRVSHNGSVWLCVLDNGAIGTTVAPADGLESTWLCEVRKGTDGATGGKGDTGATGAKGEPGKDGLRGLQGDKGDQGIAGAKGADGQTSYFHIKYSPVASPTAAQMTETPSAFIGTYVDFTEADSSIPSKYNWARFEGIQGATGERGIPGIGVDGKTSYLHIKYSDNGTAFTANNGETPGAYIGQYTDFTEADSSVFSKYAWTKIKGDTGGVGESITGRMLRRDPEFREGLNGCGIYNNEGNGNVTLSRIVRPSDCPTTSTHCLQVTTTGVANPGHGGYAQIILARANGVFISRIVAKIPIDYTMLVAHNPYGDGGKTEALTSMAGTGKYETYIWRVTCGATGTFNSINHYYLQGGAAPVTWYVASSTAYDMNDTEKYDDAINDVQTAVDSANSTLAAWKSDSVISPPEKRGLKQLHQKAIADKAQVDTEASRWSLTASATYQVFVAAAGLAFAAYNKYTAGVPENIAIGADYANIAAFNNHIVAMWNLIDSAAKGHVDGLEIGDVNLCNNSYPPTPFEGSATKYLMFADGPRYYIKKEHTYTITAELMVDDDFPQVPDAGIGFFVRGMQDVYPRFKPTTWTVVQLTFKAEIDGYLDAYHFPNGSSGRSYIRWVKLVEGSKSSVTWSPSLEDVQGQIDASNAKIAEMADDNKLTPSEKQQTAIEWERIKKEHAANHATATSLGVATGDLVSAYNTLNSLINTVLENLTITSDINGVQFRTAFAQWYEKNAAITVAIGKAQSGDAKVTIIDATRFDQNTYYPITFALQPTKTASIRVGAELYNSGVPAWATHGGGFSMLCEWTSNGHQWGVIPIGRRINKSTWGWAQIAPFGDIGQMTNTSHEYIYVRGGGYYVATTNNVTAITLHPFAFTLAEQTIAPKAAVTQPKPTDQVIQEDAAADAMTKKFEAIESFFGGAVNRDTIEAIMNGSAAPFEVKNGVVMMRDALVKNLAAMNAFIDNLTVNKLKTSDGKVEITGAKTTIGALKMNPDGSFSIDDSSVAGKRSILLTNKPVLTVADIAAVAGNGNSGAPVNVASTTNSTKQVCIVHVGKNNSTFTATGNLWAFTEFTDSSAEARISLIGPNTNATWAVVTSGNGTLGMVSEPINGSVVVNAGTYTLTLTTTVSGALSKCGIDSAQMAWDFVGSIKETQIGSNGIVTAWGTNDYEHTAFSNGRLRKTIKAVVDSPGVLAAGSIDSGSGFLRNYWSPRECSCERYDGQTGKFKVTHRVGHLNYYATGTIVGDFVAVVVVLEKTTSYVVFGVRGLDWGYHNADIDFQICGQN